MRYDDRDTSPKRWTNAKLMSEAKRLAAKGPVSTFPPKDEAERASRYRGWHESWLGPVLDEIELRFLKLRNEKRVAEAAARKREADRVDGYDRDDLGETYDPAERDGGDAQ